MGQTLSQERYRYEPLEVHDRHIRLLTLYPSCDAIRQSNRIKCSTAQHSLNWNPSYESLSYSWGDPNDLNPVPIEFNGYDHYIPKNLYAALDALRYRDRSRVLWIDALCIDQSNAVEKSRQIGMMGSIYESASNVVIWLGAASRDSELAMSTIDAFTQGSDLESLTDE